MLTFAAAHTHCWDTYARRCTQHTHGHTHTYSHTHTYCFAARGIQKCGKRFPSSRAILPRRPTVRFRDEVLTNCPTTVSAEMGELAALPMLPTALCCRARCLNLQTLGERERERGRHSGEHSAERTQVELARACAIEPCPMSHYASHRAFLRCARCKHSSIAPYNSRWLTIQQTG